VRSLVREILEQDGHRVVEARHGREALERLQVMEAPPDLVVTDVVMPEMGGRALGEALRGRRPQTAILFVSGYSDDAPALTALQDARTAFLPKPFDAASLLERVRALLPARRPA
jgi:CheY-like chemotaxis protein